MRRHIGHVFKPLMHLKWNIFPQQLHSVEPIYLSVDGTLQSKQMGQSMLVPASFSRDFGQRFSELKDGKGLLSIFII